MNTYKIYLELIRLALEDETYERTLISLGKAIAKCEKNIKNSESSNNQDYIDAVVDFEVEVIENLLGTSFVVCQTYITNIISKIISLHKYHNKHNTKLKLKITSNKKIDILLFDEKIDRKSKLTKVQVIDAFANYFKHRDEWRVNWDKLTGKSANTAKLIISVGAESGCNGNLRLASKKLGNDKYKNTIVFYNIIKNWSQKLYDEYSAELKMLKLISV